jgi:hypothetical protein
MSDVLRSVRWAAAAGLVPLALALALLPGRRELALELYLLLLAACAVYPLVLAVARTAPSAEPEKPVRQRRSSQRLPELDRTERAVLLSASSAFDVHYRLRPILREIAAQRLASRRGLSLDNDGEAARALAGEEAWELIRPDREPPHLRHAAGLPAAQLSEVVAALERI